MVRSGCETSSLEFRISGYACKVSVLTQLTIHSSIIISLLLPELHGGQTSIMVMMCGRDEKEGWTILVASKDESVQTLVADSLLDGQNTILSVHSVKAFFEKLSEGGVNLIIYDPDLHPMDTMSAFAIAKVYHPNISSILIYGNENYEVTKSILDKGVLFRMLKPMNKDDLKQICDGIRRRKTREAFDSILEFPITLFKPSV